MKHVYETPEKDACINTGRLDERKLDLTRELGSQTDEQTGLLTEADRQLHIKTHRPKCKHTVGTCVCTCTIHTSIST